MLVKSRRVLPNNSSRWKPDLPLGSSSSTKASCAFCSQYQSDESAVRLRKRSSLSRNASSVVGLVLIVCRRASSARRRLHSRSACRCFERAMNKLRMRNVCRTSAATMTVNCPWDKAQSNRGEMTGTITTLSTFVLITIN